MSKHDKNANEPVTKKEFNERLDIVDKRFEKIEFALQNQANELIRHREKIDTLATKDDVDKILSAVDNIARNVIDVERKSIVNTHRINEIETKIEEYGKRISRLETVHK